MKISDLVIKMTPTPAISDLDLRSRQSRDWMDVSDGVVFLPPPDSHLDRFIPKATVAERTSTALVTTPVAVSVETTDTESLAEYALAAAEIGLTVTALAVEQFKQVLKKLDIPVYPLSTVVPYMDAKAAKEGNGWGWCWYPLRSNDVVSEPFGRGSSAHWMNGLPASDHSSPNYPTYNRTVPLHALKRIAVIEKVYPGKVAFMVTDYAPKPEYRPDPFLMAVIDNPNLGTGEGRFVIDFWDEPGFGLEKMLGL